MNLDNYSYQNYGYLTSRNGENGTERLLAPKTKRAEVFYPPHFVKLIDESLKSQTMMN